MKQLMVVLGFLCVLGIMSVGHAASVAPEQVRVAAETWMARHPDFQGATIRAWEAMPGATAHNTLYKATVSPSGFLIVNGNDVLPVVPLYSAHGGVPVPPGAGVEGDPFAALLASIAEAGEAQCVDAEANPDAYRTQQAAWQALLPVEKKLGVRSLKTAAITTQAVREYTTNVGPLIRSNWYQGLPLNYFAPTDGGGGEGGGVVIGCTATAVAMMMDANQWPTYGKGTYLFDHFARVPNQMPTCGFFLADTRAKYHWKDMITQCADGPAWERLQTNRMGMDVGTLIDSDFKSGGTGSGFWNNPGALFNHFRYKGDIVICAQSTANTAGDPNRYVRDWIPRLRESIIERLPAYVMITGHSIACDGFREFEVNGVTNTEVCLNLGFGGAGFWVDVSRIDFEDETATDANAWKGWYYFHSMIVNVRPNPVPLPDPVPRMSTPDTVVSWEIPKHYMEMQSGIIKQRVKIVGIASSTGVNEPFTSQGVTITNFGNNDGEFNSSEQYVKFSNYNTAIEYATFNDSFVVSSNSKFTALISSNLYTLNRYVILEVSQNNGSTWIEAKRQLVGASINGAEFNCDLGAYVGQKIRLRLSASVQTGDNWPEGSSITITNASVDNLVTLGTPAFSSEFPAQRYNSMKLSEIPGLTMPTGSESKYYKFRVELFADQKRGAGPRWYPTSLEDGTDDPNCPDNDTWIETNISNTNLGVLPTADLPLNITTKGKGVPTIIPLPSENSYTFTTSVPGGIYVGGFNQNVVNHPAFDIEIETTATNKLLKVAANKEFIEHPLAGDKRQQNSILTLKVTAPDGSQVYEQTALSSRVAGYSAWSTNLSAAVSIATKRQMTILRYSGATLPVLSDKEEAVLSSTFILYHDTEGASANAWTFCGQNGAELFSFGSDALRNAYIDAVAHRRQPVLPSGMTFNATGDLSDKSHDWIVESGATMPANQRIYRVTFKSGSTIAYVSDAQLSVVKGCTFETNVTASIGTTIVNPQPFILSETPIVGMPTPNCHAIATANGDREYILVADSSVHVSYSATVAENSTWTGLTVTPTDFGTGADYKRLALTPTTSSTLDFENKALQMYSLTVNNGASLTLTNLNQLQVGTFDLAASQRVVMNDTPGASKIVAGNDTVLKHTGTGRLTINTGKQATLDGITWADANLVNNGTLVYAGNQANVMPRTSGVQVIATPMAWTSTFDWRGPLLTVRADTTAETFNLKSSNASVTIDGVTLTTPRFAVEGDNLAPTIRVINGGQLTVNGEMKLAHYSTARQPTYEVSGVGSTIRANKLNLTTWFSSADQKVNLVDGGMLSVGSGGFNNSAASNGYDFIFRNGILAAHANWTVNGDVTCKLSIYPGSTATLEPNSYTITYNRSIVDQDSENGPGTLVIGTPTTTGRVILTQANPNFTGGTMLAGGTLELRNDAALGTNTTNTILMMTGGTLALGTNTLSVCRLARQPVGTISLTANGLGKRIVMPVTSDFTLPASGLTLHVTASNKILSDDSTTLSIEDGMLVCTVTYIPSTPPYSVSLTGDTAWTTAPWQDSSTPSMSVPASDWEQTVGDTNILANTQVASTITLDRSITLCGLKINATQPLTLTASEGATFTAFSLDASGMNTPIIYDLPLDHVTKFWTGADSTFNYPIKELLSLDDFRTVLNYGTNYQAVANMLFSYNALSDSAGTGRLLIGDGVKDVSLSITDANVILEMFNTDYYAGGGALTVNTNAALALSTLWKGATTVYGSLRSSGRIQGTLTFEGGTLIAQTNTCLEVTGAVTGSAQIDVSALGNSTNRIAVLKAPGITTTGFTVPTPYALTVDANTLYVQSAEVRVIFAGADATEVSLEEPVRHYLTEKFHAAREDAPTLPTVVRLQAVTQDGAVVHTGSLAAEVTQMLELTPEFTADGDTTRATVAYEFRCDDFQLTTGGVKLSARLDSAHKQHGAINGRLVIQKCLPNGTWEDVPDSAQSGPTFTREGTSGAWRFAHDYLLTLPEHNCMFRVIIKP